MISKTTILIILIIFIQITSQAGDREYYKTIGVKQSASQKEIKQAYRKLSQQFHPDHCKDGKEVCTDRFAKINVAYEVLSNPEKRKKYDQYGEEGLKQQVDRSNPFAGFGFGGFGGFGGQQQERKGPDLFVKIQVTLEDIYNGKEIPVFLIKETICPHCRGSGADDPNDVVTCTACNGLGVTMKKQQIAPGFVQQFQATCDKCNGKGKIYKSKCHVCRGKKIITGTDKIALFVEKGIQDRHTIKFDNAGDDRDDQGTSDVVFQIITVPHHIFERRKNDLYAKVQLTLKEALLGFKKKLKHLDGHYVKMVKEGVTQPNEVKKFKGEGMPNHEYSSIKGDLYIEYKVNFPSTFTEEQLNLWDSVLGQ